MKLTDNYLTPPNIARWLVLGPKMMVDDGGRKIVFRWETNFRVVEERRLVLYVRAGRSGAPADLVVVITRYLGT